MTKVERIINAEVRSGGSGGSGEKTPVRAVVIRGTTEVEGVDVHNASPMEI
ncbi:hypothetical protein F2Q69_00004255 [Brassica cretica]|uniref:Uncharacterized protein n=1 Tax=Brassica cretica TaxID=69181 RepID=A0A8S9P0P2_BRACR|nr:hypothetical protein F2Q69_00004255 [Brassica cretica]